VLLVVVSGEPDGRVTAKPEFVDDLIPAVMEGVADDGGVIPADSVLFQVFDIVRWGIQSLSLSFVVGRGGRGTGRWRLLPFQDLARQVVDEGGARGQCQERPQRRQEASWRQRPACGLALNCGCWLVSLKALMGPARGRGRVKT